LGNGNTNGVYSPPDNTLIDLCGGDSFTMGVLPNHSGGLGRNSSGEDNVPYIYQWHQLSAGNAYACGLCLLSHHFPAACLVVAKVAM